MCTVMGESQKVQQPMYEEKNEFILNRAPQVPGLYRGEGRDPARVGAVEAGRQPQEGVQPGPVDEVTAHAPSLLNLPERRT